LIRNFTEWRQLDLIFFIRHERILLIIFFLIYLKYIVNIFFVDKEK
jgi:hypothetical protein